MSGGAELFFVDTNVLLYSMDSAEPAKRELAREWMQVLWESRSGRLSWQVLNEFYANAVGKLRQPTARARESVEALVLWQPAGFGIGIMQRAWHWGDRAGVPFWDASILASAESMGCGYLLSEDFQEGREFSGVTVVNPFHSAPAGFFPS
jgi:predicted nucleic acid-binding protein